MKPKPFAALLLFVSSYSPLFLIFAVKDWNFDKSSFNHPWLIGAILVAAGISIALLWLTFATLNKGNLVITIKNVENRSMDLINYTIPYILSFFSFDLSKPADVISLAIFLLILFVLTVRSHSIFINPILAFAGYGLYDMEFEFDAKGRKTVVLARQELHTNQRYYARPLTPYLYVIVAEDNERKV